MTSRCFLSCRLSIEKQWSRKRTKRVRCPPSLSLDGKLCIEMNEHAFHWRKVCRVNQIIARRFYAPMLLPLLAQQPSTSWSRDFNNSRPVSTTPVCMATRLEVSKNRHGAGVGRVFVFVWSSTRLSLKNGMTYFGAFLNHVVCGLQQHTNMQVILEPRRGWSAAANKQTGHRHVLWCYMTVIPWWCRKV